MIIFPEGEYRGIRKFLICSVLAQKTAGTFVPQIAEEKRLLDAVGHLPGSFSEGNCCYGEKEKGKQDFPVSRMKARDPWGAPLKCLMDLLVRVMFLGCVFTLIP